MSGVLPGSYVVFATTNGGVTGGVAVDVGDADVDGILISATSGFRLSGRFVLDGGFRNEAVKMSDLRAAIVRDPDILGMPSGGPTFSPPPGEDGEFVLEGVGIGDFRVTVRGLPAGAYVKSMRMGGVDVFNDGLHVFGPSKEPLEVVIGVDGGAVNGRVVSATNEPLANRTVVAVPETQFRHRGDLFKTTVTDRSGRFRIQGLTPGAYTVLAWENVESDAWQDPDFFRGYENRGIKVRVGPATEQSIELAVIP
jgi:hypothetical protein